MGVKFHTDIGFRKIKDLKPTPGNPNYVPPQILESLKKHIAKEGFFGAIVINKFNEVVDGWHRLKALESLGEKEVPVISEDKWNKTESRIQTLRFNREKGYLTPTETGNMLHEIMLDGVPLDIIQKQTDIPMDDLPILMDLVYDPVFDQNSQKDGNMSWADVEKLTAKLAGRIQNLGIIFNRIYTKSRGGLIPSRLIADKLGIDEIIVDKPILKSHIKDSIFIDDIYDSGKTYKEYTNGRIYGGFFYIRKDVKAPEGVIFAEITKDNSYIKFVWEKTENRTKK